jgi:HSP20 family protein
MNSRKEAPPVADATRWDPFQEMTTLQSAMNQLLSESVVRPRWGGSQAQVPLNLYETEHEYVVELAAPGLKPENFDVTMQHNALLINGRIQAEQQEGVRYHILEQRFGDFSRSIQFPSAVDVDKAQANLANGVLTIRIPKSEAAKPKRIAVKTE